MGSRTSTGSREMDMGEGKRQGTERIVGLGEVALWEGLHSSRERRRVGVGGEERRKGGGSAELETSRRIEMTSFGGKKNFLEGS